MKIYAGDIIRLTPLAPIGKDLAGEQLTCSVLEIIEHSDEKEIVVLDQYGEDWLLKQGQYTLYERVNPKHEKLGYVLQTVKDYYKIELEEVELDTNEVKTLIGDAKILESQINQILSVVNNKKGMGGLTKKLNEILAYTQDYIKNTENYKGEDIQEKQFEMEDVCSEYGVSLYNLY